ncbi:MAG: imidazole glycerol phosphate synthase subunit HisH [Bacteroidota bacterium]
MTGIIDYGAGNIRSVSNALSRLSVKHFVSDRIDDLCRATRLILPGVGEARQAMDSLTRRGLPDWLRTVDVPFLGICLGMQLLFENSEERQTPCLGLLPGTIIRFPRSDLKVPHMGWNQVQHTPDNPLFTGIRQNESFYFVHSYLAPQVSATTGTTTYGVTFTSAVQYRQYFGVQFHPEKSGPPGLKLLENFIHRC